MRQAAILLLASACTAATAAPRATIDLQPDAQVQGDTVVLGQVALLHSGDLELMRRLVHLPLGRAPRNGELAVLRQEGLRLWIRRETGLTATDVDIRGAQESRVFGAAHRVKGEEIARAAIEAVQSIAAAHDVQVRVPVRDLDVPAAAVLLQARPVEPAAMRRNMVVWIDVLAAGTLVRTVPVSLHLPYADRPDGALRRPGTPPLQSALSSAAPVGREPLGVVRGDWATLRSVAGPVVLEASVEVLQDGRAGDKVRVRQRGATALVMARVVGPGRVELAP